MSYRFPIIPFLFIVTFGLFLSTTDAQSTTYARVKMTLEDKSDIQLLMDLGVPADHVHTDGKDIELVLSDEEQEILDTNGFDYTVLVKNIKTDFEKKHKHLQSLKSNSSFCDLDLLTAGETGFYHSYEEVIQIIQTLATEYPDIFSYAVLGQSYEGRNIVSVKISDNVQMDESGEEPAVYYDALTHAREPLSMESTLYYMIWLVENYDKNAEASYLIHNRELFFIPIVNPDGYVYNLLTSPEGGGGWRKNRRPVGNDCIGVDLNRNFAVHWDGPGSHSENPCSALYRGEEPASEVETQLVQNFIDEINPKSGFSSHSFSQVMLDPDKIQENSSYSFQQYANHASEFTPKEYRGYGSADYLIGYLASGTTLDYLNGKGAVAWTPEIGTMFWEPANLICTFVEEMQLPLKYVALLAGAFPSFHRAEILNNDIASGGDILRIAIQIKNKGISNTDKEVVVKLVPLGNGLTPLKNIDMYPNIDVNSLSDNSASPFLFIIADDIELGAKIPIAVETFYGDEQIDVDIINYYPGTKEVIFEDDFENGMDSWLVIDSADTWSLTTTDSQSGQYALVDSRKNYSPSQHHSIQTKEPLNLTGFENPYISFFAKHSLQPNNDIVQLQVSLDNQTWTSIRGEQTVKNGDKHYMYGHSYWYQERMSLVDYANVEELFIRFDFESDGGFESDGVYIDDFRLFDYSLNPNATSTEVEEIINYSIKPNPTRSTIYIESEKLINEKVQVSVLTSLGQTVLANSYEHFSSEQLDLSAYPNGVYYIILKVKASITSHKIVKL